MKMRQPWHFVPMAALRRGIIDEIFLRVVCRTPSEAERQACLSYVRESATPADGFRGVMWSLLNTREFLLQH